MRKTHAPPGHGHGASMAGATPSRSAREESTIRHDEETAHREVDFIARKLEDVSRKPV